ncbi:MAG: PHP domain-containing protein, partial [Candidatus Heimdallarchaeota archaeon]
LEEEPSSIEFPAIAQEIQEQGGMVIIPHPFDTIRGKRFRVTEADLPYIDAIEVFNSRCILPRANNKALKLAEKFSIRKTAGSDAHFAPEIGRAWISFNGLTCDEFRKSLIKGETTVEGKRAPMTVHFHTFNHRLRRTFRRNQ